MNRNGRYNWTPKAPPGENEAGVAMIVAIGVSFVVLLLGILSFNLANASITGSSQFVRFETALHVAEHGVDQTLARLKADRLYTTGPAMPAGGTAQQDEAWARAQLATASVEGVPQGEFAVLRPANRNIVFAQGWIPNRAAPRQERLLRVEYLLSGYSPGNAILTAGPLDITGNAAVLGISGNVHSNSDVTVGNTASVSGVVSASGSISSMGSVGALEPGAGEQDVPPIRPRDMYDTLSASSAAWYDLCPDATARAHAAPGSAPCTGTVSDASGNFRGWNHSTSGGGVWQYNDSNAYNGVYYVYRSNAVIGSSPGTTAAPWLATVITEKNNNETPCLQNFGDINVSGSPKLRGYVEGLALVAGRDLAVNGTTNQSFEGFLGAQEQVRISGNGTIIGAIVAENRCDTPSSPVNQNEISGSMQLTFNSGQEVPLSGIVRTTLWLEL